MTPARGSWLHSAMQMKSLLLGLTAAALTATVQAAQPVTRQGTSILHYTTLAPLVATEAAPLAEGALEIRSKEQGKSGAQSFELVASHLPTNAVLSLVALMNDDTNPIVVLNFTTDAAGEATLHLGQRIVGKALPGKSTLPAALDPLARLNAISIVQHGTQTLAYAWVNTSPKFQYLVKRNLTDVDLEGDAIGSIHLKANAQNVNFRLRAGMLIPQHDYNLVINGKALAAAKSDKDGVVQFKDWPTNAPAILDLRVLEVRDGNYPVLRTLLPK